MDFLACTLVIGAGATAMTDFWTFTRKRLLDIPVPDYGLVGRWVGHMAHGCFRHDRIAASPAIHGERLVGWTTHYVVGIGFAALLLGICGLAWVRHPTIGPALLVGICTVAAPFFIMQPGMGAGIAASRTPRPNAARIQSLITHAVFGVGLYTAGEVAGFLGLAQ
ncbi:MAG TPA: DUF2938 domain-containing protein [Burkholderiales bacterium]|nr:DUF2938 domain-containing protein [Burkholderiales bacterium]